MENAAATPVRLNAMPNDNEEVTVSVSTGLTESGWDNFLRTTPLGEIQQSSIWARYKRIDGWECTRFMLRGGQEIKGGFQLLWRATRFGRIGYVSKGPVLKEETAERIETLIQSLIDAAEGLRLRALVIQPPNLSRITSHHLDKAGFIQDRMMEVISATLWVDVSASMLVIEDRMRRKTRQLIRKAIRQGVRVREGNVHDLGTFFRLMLDTCKRHNTAPNPATESALKELWVSAQPSAACRLTLAEQEGQAIAGLMCIPFGEVLTGWKKGMLTDYMQVPATELLYHEMLSWAHRNGLKYCDFGAMNRSIAEALIQGRMLSEEQKKSRDFFNLGFGGKPVLLPEAYIYFPSPILATGYRWAVRSSFLNRYLKRAVS